MWEVKPARECCRTAILELGSDRNSNEAVAGAALESFASWLHYQYAGAYRFAMR